MNDMPALQFDWANRTNIHPVGMAAVVVLGAALLVLPRRWALLPMLAVACFISPAQRIVALELNFDLLRLMVLTGWLRLLLRGEMRDFRWKPLDGWLVLWALGGTVVYAFGQGSLAALKFKLGTSFDAIGMYFLFRNLVRDWSDVDCVARIAVLVSVPVALAFVLERATGKNIFAVFGYVPASTISRAGHLRCQGAFAHPILAGCFWASLMPLMAARAWQGARGRRQAALGLACSGLIIFCCASSTPVVAVFMGVAAAAMFPLRNVLKWIAVAFLVALVELHLVMKAPVWHLIGRMGILGGSTGWHRYYLINEAVNHLEEWWLLGTRSTAHWGYGLFDVTNQYVLEGVRGGLLTLVLFVAMIGAGFAAGGRLWRFADSDRHRLVLAWALGTGLFIHCLNFIAVSYFGQIILLWYLTLAMIAGLAPGSSRSLIIPVSEVARYRRLGYWPRVNADGSVRRYGHYC
jgi:hypothetical protein